MLRVRIYFQVTLVSQIQKQRPNLQTRDMGTFESFTAPIARATHFWSRRGTSGQSLYIVLTRPIVTRHVVRYELDIMLRGKRTTIVYYRRITHARAILLVSTSRTTIRGIFRKSHVTANQNETARVQSSGSTSTAMGECPLFQTVIRAD